MTARAPANALRPLARAKRLSLREQWVRAFFAAVDRAGSSYAEVAEACGRTRQKVSQWASLDPDAPLPTVLDEMSFPPAVSVELDAWKAMLRARVLVSAAPDVLDHAARASLLTQQCTDLVCEYIAALADGHVSPAERVGVCDRLRSLIACSSSALLALEQEGRAATGSDGQ